MFKTLAAFTLVFIYACSSDINYMEYSDPACSKLISNLKCDLRSCWYTGYKAFIQITDISNKYITYTYFNGTDNICNGTPIPRIAT